MEPPYHTPFLDCFRRGEVASDIRMMAAQGVLAPRAQEQLGLLVLLTADSVPAIRAAAEHTIGRIPRGTIARFIGRPDVSPEIREFFGRRGVEPEYPAALSSDAPLVDAGQAAEPEEQGEEAADADAAGAELHRLATIQRLAMLTVSEKIKAAMRGSREERGILIRDPNKLVSLAVLSSPKVNDAEIESYAKMANVSEEALRVIGSSRAWIKNYAIVRALAFNPKAPISLSMTLVGRLLEKDLRKIALDRNIAEPVKILARKTLQAGSSRRA